jgi:ceramide glucosyltransferase
VFLTVGLATLALLTVPIMLWQWAVAWRFPLHRRAPLTGFAPGVTVLKPLKGCDAETRACLRSWLTQAYAGPVQVLFGVASAEDPVCAVVRELLREGPQADAELVLCQEALGLNPKVSTLVQLERRAKHDLVVISDADVWVPPDLLARVVDPLGRPDVGLVNCLYRLSEPANGAMRLEALAVNADFWTQVLQARCLGPMDFALGAVMALRRAQLGAIGGLSALLDYLADDFQLGRRVAQTGSRIELIPVVVDCRSAPVSPREVWAHQLRWARTIRVCRPGPFFLSILGNATLWPLLWWLSHPTSPVAFGAGACLVLRWITAALNERKMTGRGSWATLWAAPVKDLLQAALWALAFAEGTVRWRGVTLQARAGGRLVRR